MASIIDLTQVNGVPPSGSIIVLGSEVYPLQKIYVRELEVEIPAPSVEVSEFNANVLQLNGTGSLFGGLLIRDTNGNTLSGSLLWDTQNDRWIAGPVGQEETILLQLSGSGTQHFLQKSTGDGKITDSRISDNGTDVLINAGTGSVKIIGNLIVEGTTTLVQKTDINQESLIVSGAMSIVKNEISSQIMSASLNIENLGTLSDRNKNSIIDLGGFF